MRTLTRAVSPGPKVGMRFPLVRLATSSFSRSLLMLAIAIVLSYWALPALCLLFGEMRRPEVRPALPRGLLPLVLPPLRHLAVVAGQQNLRDLLPFERPRPG